MTGNHAGRVANETRTIRIGRARVPLQVPRALPSVSAVALVGMVFGCRVHAGLADTGWVMGQDAGRALPAGFVMGGSILLTRPGFAARGSGEAEDRRSRAETERWPACDVHDRVATIMAGPVDG